MSGTRYFNFREGDRSEYLATYFFSAIGLVTPVPRQEDIGFDLVCSIADQETGRLTFNHQFLLSIKSLSTPGIELLPAESEDGSLPHLSWLFRQELPLLLAVVEKETQEIQVFSTLPKWFVYFENPDCGAVTLAPRVAKGQFGDVGRPVKGEEIKGLAGKYHYTVDLGYPILRANVSELKSRSRVKEIKERMRLAVYFGRLTAIHVQLGVPYFYWFARTHIDGSEPTAAFFANQVPDVQEAQDFIYGRIAPTLISMAMLYKAKKEADKLQAVIKLLRAVPKESIPDVIRANLPELNGFF
jgi:hypothetical protein